MHMNDARAIFKKLLSLPLLEILIHFPNLKISNSDFGLLVQIYFVR